MSIINNNSTLEIEKDLKQLLDTINENLNCGLKKIVSNISKKMNDYDETFHGIISLPAFKTYIEKMQSVSDNNMNTAINDHLLCENEKLKNEIVEYQKIIKNKNKEFDALNNVQIFEFHQKKI